MTSTPAQLRERGYLYPGDIDAASEVTTADLLVWLESPKAAQRSAAIHSLCARMPLDRTLAQKFVSMLARERKLYTKLELGAALQSGGVIAASELIPLLGKIGTNQHQAPDPAAFLKSSYPLPRDLAARILARMDHRVLPELVTVLEEGSRRQRAEVLDAIGFLWFYSAANDAQTVIAVERALTSFYDQHQADDLLRWKFVRCCESFHGDELTRILTDVKDHDSSSIIRREADRSLRIAAGRRERSTSG